MNDATLQVREFIARGDGWTWLALMATAVLLTFAIKAGLKLVSKRLRRLTQATRSVWDDAFVDVLDGLKKGTLFMWIFYPLSKAAAPPEGVSKFLLLLVVVATALQVAIWGFYLIRKWRDSVLRKKIEKDASSAAALGLMYTAVEALFVITIVLIALSNLGVNIGALVAGLGIGGIAVALAAQNILGDLLASLSIALDKPFIVGDFLVIGNEMGTVEDIGIKTTRVRSLSGEQLIFSNKDLLESRIRNFKRMYERRVVHTFGVTYATPAEKLEQIPVWVKAFVDKQPKLRFDRCHFVLFAASSLNIELVFWVKDPDFNVYADLQQALLLDIMRKFAAEGVQFAFPTQTLFLEASEGAPTATRPESPRREGQPTFDV